MHGLWVFGPRFYMRLPIRQFCWGSSSDRAIYHVRKSSYWYRNSMMSRGDLINVTGDLIGKKTEVNFLGPFHLPVVISNRSDNLGFDRQDLRWREHHLMRTGSSQGYIETLLWQFLRTKQFLIETEPRITSTLEDEPTLLLPFYYWLNNNNLTLDLEKVSQHQK